MRLSDTHVPVARRLTLEDAHVVLRKDTPKIRDMLGISSAILAAGDLNKIVQAWAKFSLENHSEYSYYDIGHTFIVDHLIASVKKNIGLKHDEERLLGSVLGRLYYNPPEREFIEKINAAEKLATKGERGSRILSCLKEEVSNFQTMCKSAKVKTDLSDMFANPLSDIILFVSSKRSFEEIAKSEREFVVALKRLERKNGSESFYR